MSFRNKKLIQYYYTFQPYQKSPSNKRKYHRLDLQHIPSLLNVLTHTRNPCVTIKMALHTQKKITRIMAAAKRKVTCRKLYMKFNIPLQCCLPGNPHSPSYHSSWATWKYSKQIHRHTLSTMHRYEIHVPSTNFCKHLKWSNCTGIKSFNNFLLSNKKFVTIKKPALKDNILHSYSVQEFASHKNSCFKHARPTGNGL